LKRLRVANKADVSIKSFELSDLLVIASDESNISIDAEIQTLEINLSDDSRLNLENRIAKLSVTAFQNVRIYGYDAYVMSATIRMENDVRVRINVEDELVVYAQDRSSVNYKGNPRIEIRSQSNAASVSKY
jgi:hypothetical protein